MKMRGLGLVALALVSVAAISPAAAQTVAGTANTSNCYPFSCFASDGGLRFQQVYNASSLAGMSTFNSISFFRAVGSGATNSATYSISFSNTSRSAATLSTDLASNVTGPSTQFGSFTIGGSVPSILTFLGNSFTYDATLGNLLMDVTVSDVTSTANSYQTFFQADNTRTQIARAYSTSSDSFAGNNALVTRFDQVAGAVPEPATWAMMILGFGMVGFGMRRGIHRSNAKFDLKVRRIAAGLEA